MEGKEIQVIARHFVSAVLGSIRRTAVPRLADFLSLQRGLDDAYRISLVPGSNLRQVNIYDPDGNHIEIAFAAEEVADLSDYPTNGA